MLNLYSPVFDSWFHPFPQDPLVEGVQRIIDDVAAWSFKQCLRNEYPETDHDGIPLRNSRGRQGPLHPGGAIPVFTGTVGDWKWHVETFNLQHHYGRDETCELCLATKTAGDLNLGNASLALAGPSQPG